MPVRASKIQKEEDVTMLADMDVRYISLVPHGANGRSFRVVKKYEKESLTMKSIHRIISHGKTPYADIVKNNPWLQSLGGDVVKTDNGWYVEHLPQDQFAEKSWQIQKITEDVFILSGELTTDRADAVIPPDTTKSIGVAAMDAQVKTGETKKSELTRPFGEMVGTETDALLGVVFGALKQTAGNGKSRKKTVLNAIDAYREFMDSGLDMIGAEALELSYPATPAPEDTSDVVQTEFVEITNPTDDVVKLVETLKGAGVFPKLPEENPEVAELKTTIAELTERVKNLSGQPTAISASVEDDDVTAGTSATTTEPDPDEKLFSGVLV